MVRDTPFERSEKTAEETGMTRAEYLRKKRNNRRKRIVIAYAARALIFAVLTAVTFLIVCGCIYVAEFF